MTQSKNRADELATEILEAFEGGELPKALAPVFLQRHYEDIPANNWTWGNRLLVAKKGHPDARGFRQWKDVGRAVKKGEKALYILGPITGKRDAQEGEEPTTKDGKVTYVRGFKAIPVFGLQQTEGEPMPYELQELEFFASLPLVEVARKWGLDVSYLAHRADALGCYRPEQAIFLRVENLATWAHELVHAADDRAGNLTRGIGQRLHDEVVAELGGAILLECLGLDQDSDRGGAWDYINAYCAEHEREPLSVCNELLDRTCTAVALILDEAGRIELPEAELLQTA